MNPWFVIPITPFFLLVNIVFAIASLFLPNIRHWNIQKKVWVIFIYEGIFFLIQMIFCAILQLNGISPV
ncbi:hypothetical protein [Faecalicoccus pleomorphus]|uniref:hypothetical protein n=1 Tax=Faecalicoccus pleomorphus TaxID=1323 RepID=UPI0029429FDC|nr:hypothetical protein [Faecalicoccus pleomorphus]